MPCSLSWPFSNGQGWSLEIRFHLPSSPSWRWLVSKGGCFHKDELFPDISCPLTSNRSPTRDGGACPSLDMSASGDSRSEACRQRLSRSPQQAGIGERSQIPFIEHSLSAWQTEYVRLRKPRLLHEITPFDGQYHYHNVTLVQNVNQGIQCIFERGWGKGIFTFYNLKMKFKRSSKNVSSCRNKVRDMLKNFHLSQCRYCDRVMPIVLIIWCFLDLLLDLAVNFLKKFILFYPYETFVCIVHMHHTHPDTLGVQKVGSLELELWTV